LADKPQDPRDTSTQIVWAEFRDAIPVPPAPHLGRISDRSTQVQASNGWTLELRQGALRCAMGSHVIDVPLSNVKWMKRA
jgi:hypothetical protein